MTSTESKVGVAAARHELSPLESDLNQLKRTLAFTNCVHRRELCLDLFEVVAFVNLGVFLENRVPQAPLLPVRVLRFEIPDIYGTQDTLVSNTHVTGSWGDIGWAVRTNSTNTCGRTPGGISCVCARCWFGEHVRDFLSIDVSYK